MKAGFPKGMMKSARPARRKNGKRRMSRAQRKYFGKKRKR